MRIEFDTNAILAERLLRLRFAPPYQGKTPIAAILADIERRAQVRVLEDALSAIAALPDFPPAAGEWPARTDPEHMWHDMVMMARRALDDVRLLRAGKPLPTRVVKFKRSLS